MKRFMLAALLLSVSNALYSGYQHIPDHFASARATMKNRVLAGGTLVAFGYMERTNEIYALATAPVIPEKNAKASVKPDADSVKPEEDKKAQAAEGAYWSQMHGRDQLNQSARRNWFAGLGFGGALAIGSFYTRSKGDNFETASNWLGGFALAALAIGGLRGWWQGRQALVAHRASKKCSDDAGLGVEEIPATQRSYHWGITKWSDQGVPLALQVLSGEEIAKGKKLYRIFNTKPVEFTP